MPGNYTIGSSVFLAGIAIQKGYAPWDKDVQTLLARGCVWMRPCGCGYGPHPTLTPVGRWAVGELGDEQALHKLAGRLTKTQRFILAAIGVHQALPASVVDFIDDFIAQGLCVLTPSSFGTPLIDITPKGLHAVARGIRTGILRCAD